MKNRAHNKKGLSILVVVSYLITVTVNVLANALPINGVTTGEVSGKYINLFAPAGWTFAIWIPIYLLLGMYCVYQFSFNQRRPDNNDRVVRKVNFYFSLSNAINALWIVAWHYELMLVSLVLMAILLMLLANIRTVISHRSSLNEKESRAIRLPFGVYFGWITIASIANTVTYLVYSGWDGGGISDERWTVIVLVAGGVIGLVTFIRFRDIPYALVLLWAYSGILMKHTSSAYYNRVYGEVVITLYVMMAVFVAGCGYILLKGRRKRRRRSRR